MAADNRSLGRFHLDGIPPAPRGVPQIEVTFDIDANGILHVSAKDKGTNKEQSIRITSSSGLSKDEIEKMKNTAKEHAEDDRKKKEEVEIKNQADNLVFQTKKQISELGDKIEANDKSRLEAEITKLEEAIKTNNSAEIKSATESLQKIWGEAAQKLYQQPGAEQGADQNAGTQQPPQSENQAKDGKENAQDASYEVVDEDNKN